MVAKAKKKAQKAPQPLSDEAAAVARHTAEARSKEAKAGSAKAKAKSRGKRKRADEASEISLRDAEDDKDDDAGDKNADSSSSSSSSSALKKRAKKSLPPESKRGVIYLGHIPHGFYEMQMRSFFSQFGEVTRLRLARCMKTAKSKGYAFIEFTDVATAKIVAESMHNYLMFEKLLQCHYIPHARVHPECFKNQGKPIKKIHFDQNEMRHRNKRDEKNQDKISGKLLKKEEATRKRLKELGIDYDFPGYAADPAAPKAKVEKEVKTKASAVKQNKKKSARKGRPAGGK